MKATGWWAIAVGGVTGALGIYLAAAGSWTSAQWGAWAALGGVAAVYFTYGRIAVASPGAPHDVILTLLNAGLLLLGTAYNPNIAILQGVIYPLVWHTARSVRVAYLLNPVVALAVFAGMWIFAGWSNPWLGLGTAFFSLAFSLAMGAWIVSMMRHGDERSRLLDELEAAQEQLAARNQEVGASAERERIARDLHDTIAQNLTAIVMHAQRLDKARRGGHAVSTDDLTLIESLASESLTEARTLVAAMTPLDIESGLEDALRRLADRFERETGVSVTVAAVGVDREREVVALRCVQEALANVRKHAEARSVDVRVEVEDGTVTVNVQDDGVGLPEHVRDGAELGFGLAGMRSRLASVGGTLHITSSGGGTLLTARIPEAQ